MAHRPKTIGERLFMLLLAVGVASLVGLGVVASWGLLLAAVAWGPVAWASVTVLALTCVALSIWYRKVREAHALAAVEVFSFAEVAVRMRARDRTRDLIEARRREELVGAR